MADAILEAGIACIYSVAAYEARRIGHARLALCYLAIAVLVSALAACRAGGV